MRCDAMRATAEVVRAAGINADDKKPSGRMRSMMGRQIGAALLLALAAAGANAAEPPAAKADIVIGQTMPYSGPVSSGGTVGRAQAAYFDMINDRGGIKGRKLRLISLDDSFSPAKTVEQTRRLVEQDDALLIFASLGTATNRATQRYLNTKRVPQLFLMTGADTFADPKTYPYTMPGVANYGTEAAVFAKYVLQRMPNARIAILSQNDDYGRTYVSAFKAGLGERADAMIVAQATYEITEPTISSQMVTLKASNADVLMNFSLGKFTAQAIQKTRELDWKPVHFVPYAVSSPKVLAPGGSSRELAGLISTGFAKSPSDPAWADDPEYADFVAWMKKYYPGGDPTDDLNVLAYVSAGLLTHVLTAAGDDLSRDNILRVASNLRNVRVPMLLPGTAANTSPTDYHVFEGLQLLRFDGTRWSRLTD